jgi:hypothetical protein
MSRPWTRYLPASFPPLHRTGQMLTRAIFYSKVR